MLVSVTSEGGIASDGEIPRTWVIEEPSDDEKGRKGEPDKRSPVTLGADTLRLARHRGRPLRAVRRRLDLPRHRSVGEVLHHANAQPRAARRLLRQPGPRVSSNGAGETGALPEAIEGVVGVVLAVGVPAEQIDLADRSPVVRAAVSHDDEVAAEVPGAVVDAGEAAARTQRTRGHVDYYIPLADEHAEARVIRRARPLSTRGRKRRHRSRRRCHQPFDAR